jgi:hypothetical protein
LVGGCGRRVGVWGGGGRHVNCWENGQNGQYTMKIGLTCPNSIHTFVQMCLNAKIKDSVLKFSFIKNLKT